MSTTAFAGWQQPLHNLVLPVKETYKDIFHQGSAAEYEKAINGARELVTNFLHHNRQPFSGVSSATLKASFAAVDFDTPLPDYDSLLNEVQELYVKHATAFHLPAYIAHLNCPIVIPAVAAEVLIAAINSSQDTWDQSAGGTLMEQQLISWTAREIGFSNLADGVFTPGGSQSNLMGLLLARDHYAITHAGHSIKKQGLPADASRYRIFISEKAHFSNHKGAAVLGLGEQALVEIKTDERFRMDPVLLEEAINREIQQGNIPIAVVATAGTTDFGNLDPLAAIGNLAIKYKLWFHVDAAYGCGLLLTDKYRHLLNGIETANSVTVDYHKSFFQPISSSAFIVRDKQYLRLLRMHVDYLNPKDEDYDDLNQINKSIVQTTRRFDALKLWFTLRLMGKQKLGAYTETIIETAETAAQVIAMDPELELLNYSDIGVLLFRYAPEHISGEKLDNLNQYIKKSMFNEGRALIASTRVNDNFYLKFTMLNPLTTMDDVHFVLNTIKQTGAAWRQ
ncbi:pyridoxal phosphate-dependent decarboxylase family protein [Chitinophaga rhizophila]|uniref:Aspartate aminotransferase family protein n=1 Tax=Chitinophaga rhizophila TaxID=2866212 RepID=A0ABS7G8P3_9BACT|nr:aspartate aminotransferase family protein [Chitinophaga rhizophila]MBW8683159.1 aspartate aminotransferase family protein [Chitinophaga rhizophila]